MSETLQDLLKMIRVLAEAGYFVVAKARDRALVAHVQEQLSADDVWFTCDVPWQHLASYCVALVK